MNEPITYQELVALADRAQAAGQIEVSRILAGLAGSVASGLEKDLDYFLQPFFKVSLQALRREIADRN